MVAHVTFTGSNEINLDNLMVAFFLFLVGMFTFDRRETNWMRGNLMELTRSTNCGVAVLFFVYNSSCNRISLMYLIGEFFIFVFLNLLKSLKNVFKNYELKGLL